jgi:putative sigma-54 modulation protein
LATGDGSGRPGEGDVDAAPRIVRSRNYLVKPMSVAEAVLQMSSGRDDFLVFRNSRTDEVNVLYSRKDGNYGLIEPEA